MATTAVMHVHTGARMDGSILAEATATTLTNRNLGCNAPPEIANMIPELAKKARCKLSLHDRRVASEHAHGCVACCVYLEWPIPQA